MIIRQMLDHDCRPIPQVGWVFSCLLHDKQLPGSDSASVHLSFLFTSNFSFITSIRGLHGEWVDSVHVRFIFLHVLATIILSHRHERLKGWLRIRIEFAKPVWGGRVCISNPWSSGDTEWFTVTCFSLMALDWRWSCTQLFAVGNRRDIGHFGVSPFFYVETRFQVMSLL